MKRKEQFFKNLIGAMALVALFTLASCGGEDEPAPAPDASFTYVADAREVTFTNTSTDATSYSWDFGDGNTSTEENPVHVYDSYGTYTVVLTATGPGGTDASLPDDITLAKSSPVVVDGELSDWNDIPAAIVSASGEGRTINAIKVDYDADRIYFLVEGTSNVKGYFDIFMDADNNPETGYSSGWYPLGMGADYYITGDFGANQDGEIYRFIGETTDAWAWELASAAGSGAITASTLVPHNGGNAIEFSILRSALSDLSSEGFSFAIANIDTENGWATVGSLPVDNTEESQMLFFDMTN
ncbi:MAG: PKD domain-containing protein [Candidatus Cyclobacteriaceae bacterium M2_1C_046]